MTIRIYQDLSNFSYLNHNYNFIRVAKANLFFFPLNVTWTTVFQRNFFAVHVQAASQQLLFYIHYYAFQLSGNNWNKGSKIKNSKM